MPSASRIILTAAVVVFLTAAAVSQPAPQGQAGGGTLLPTGWRLQPAGRQIALDTLPMATALSRDGKSLFLLHGGQRPPSIRVIDTASKSVTGSVPVPDAWMGLVLSPAGDRLYAGGGSQASVFEFSISNGALAPARTFEVVAAGKRGNQDFIGDVQFSPDGRLLYAADLYRDSVVVINPQSGMNIQRIKTGRRPYRILFHPDGKSFFVTHWADGTLGQYDTATGSPMGTVRIGAHPTDMVWREGGPADPESVQPPGWVARLFVAAANTNNVYAVAVSQSRELRLIEGINVALAQHQPLGMTPSALALSADRNRLYVACSDANAAAVVDVSADRGFVEGFIPTGWYPTALRTLPSGALVAINGKGTGQVGSASWIDPFTPKQLDEWTKQAISNSPFYRDLAPQTPSPAPAIQHVIYILKDGAAETAKPNLQKLAREFVTFNHFDIPGEGAEAYLWSTASIVPDYVQKLWPGYAAGRRKLADFEEQDPASIPAAGYLWTSAAIAGVSLRNFGHMVNNRPSPQPGQTQVLSVRDPVLAKVTNLQFRGPDAAYSDADRSKVFLAELAEAEKSGNLARLTLVRIGSDAALGTMVEGISKSRFWNSTMVCVVDTAGRSALLISPFVKRHTTDSAVYNTASMLRTIELLLGLRPMTHFDAGARPMTASIQPNADLAPYTAEGSR